MSLTIHPYTAENTDYNTEKTERNGKTIFAGDLGIGLKDTDSIIAQKRGTAQRQALKLIGEAWDKDNALAKDKSDMDSSKSKKLADIRDIDEKLKYIEDEKSLVQEESGVDPDSQEQKDLELLEKYQNYKGGAMVDSFTDEEIDRLSELQYMPRTDYQNKILSLNSVSSQLSASKRTKEEQLKQMTKAVSNMTLEQDISQDMSNAQDTADKIMEASSKEIFGMMIQEGVDHIDDNMEEVQEKADEAEEEKEEQQEKIDKAKEDREEQEDILESDEEADKMDLNAELSKKSTTNIEDAQKNIQKIIKENNLVREDIKGIKIDFNF